MSELAARSRAVTVLNIAIVGAGKIATVHADSVRRNPGTRLTWVASPSLDAAERLAAREAKATQDAYEAISAPDVDAIIVSSITPTHVEYILAGVHAGKAVLCEKPVDLDLARAQDCLRQVEAAGGTVQIGFNRRFDPTIAEMHERVASGEIGLLEQLTIVSRDHQPPPLAYVPVSGGIFRDMTIHDLDLVRFFLGEIESVYAVGQHVADSQVKELGDFDGAVVVLQAASGSVATIINERHCSYGWDQRIEAFGPLGALRSGNQHRTSLTVSNATVNDAAERVLSTNSERYGAAFARELDAFAASVERGEPCSPGLRDGVAALELAERAAHLAHRNHDTNGGRSK